MSTLCIEERTFWSLGSAQHSFMKEQGARAITLTSCQAWLLRSGRAKNALFSCAKPALFITLKSNTRTVAQAIAIESFSFYKLFIYKLEYSSINKNNLF